jgi:hypothetical protein
VVPTRDSNAGTKYMRSATLGWYYVARMRHLHVLLIRFALAFLLPGLPQVSGQVIAITDPHSSVTFPEWVTSTNH